MYYGKNLDKMYSISQVQSNIRRDQFQKLLIYFLVLGDILFLFISLSLAYLLRYHIDYGFLQYLKPFNSHEVFMSQIILGVSLFLILAMKENFYLKENFVDWDRQYYVLIRIIFYWIIIYLCISFSFRIHPPISRVYLIYGTCISFISLFIYRVVFKKFILEKFANSIKYNVAIYLDDKESIQSISENLSQNNVFNVVFIENTNSINKTCFEKNLIENKVDIAITKMSLLNQDVYLSARKLFIDLYFENEISTLFKIKLDNINVSKNLLLRIKESPLGSYHNLLLKRCIDLIGSVIGLFISLPVSLVVATLIYLEDKGPVIFKQERIGKNGKPFYMYKFRSMKLGSEKMDNNSQSTLRNDTRLLKIGELIRKYNIDEIPQFFNVFTGNMSLVGPRPERTFHSAQLSDSIREYNARYLVKPGMSGLAQINGFRGNTDLQERIKYDLVYQQNWNLLLDFYIMIKTLLGNKNAY